ncbi:MAG: hypothetical protein J6386_13190 [Candidatus Synoicihabitans palmerolidicus]|nr:hypothetical protein [Candidatus Synoicihabitans palmerolidicus]
MERPAPIASRPIGGSAVTRTPASTELVAVWLDDTRYLLDKGQYFTNSSQGRVWVKTPVGAKIKNPPIDAITVWHQDNEYLEFGGGYFRRSPDGFKVVEAPWSTSVQDAASKR